MKRKVIRSVAALALLGAFAQSAMAGCVSGCFLVCDADGTNCHTVCGVKCTFDDLR